MKDFMLPAICRNMFFHSKFTNEWTAGLKKQLQQRDRCNFNREEVAENRAAAWCWSMLDQTKRRLMTHPPTRAVSKTNNCLPEAQLEKVNTFVLLCRWVLSQILGMFSAQKVKQVHKPESFKVQTRK